MRKCLFQHILSVTSNWVFSFVRLLRLHGKPYNILMPAQYMTLWKHERLSTGVWRWYLFRVVVTYTAEIVLNVLWLFKMKFINENMYSHWRGEISDVLNRPRYQFLGFVPATVVIILFSGVNSFLLQDRYPQNYSIFYYRLKIGKLNSSIGITARGGPKPPY
jgi:hypothetical protein